MTTIATNSIYSFSENISNLLEDSLYDQENAEIFSHANPIVLRPEITYFEQAISKLEGGKEALSFKSLYNAKISVIRALVDIGKNIVTYNSHNLFHKDRVKLLRVGIDVRISDDGSLETFRGLIDQNTRLIYLETFSKEYQSIPDFKKIISIAREFNIPVLVDNSEGGAGYISKPISYGADLVIESTRNWLPTQKSFIGAALIDAGTYNWEHVNFNYPIENHVTGEPLESQKASSLINFLKTKTSVSLHYSLAEGDSNLLVAEIKKIEALVKKQSTNALHISGRLKVNEYVDQVKFNGIPSNPNYFKALNYFRNGFGNSFIVKFREEVSVHTMLQFLNDGKGQFSTQRISAKEIQFVILGHDLDYIQYRIDLALSQGLNNHFEIISEPEFKDRLVA